ncbi:helix-turn-helix domain-containing protein [Nocardia puris]|uniref:Helix-turn-helix protein n=1 Tax=Nocardia puris TaxID=208602 RepID=A0A366D0Q2_9NOCA|nr:helix-turn-helix transcriptional regulator [Nocardia puris]MBF6215110.1 helix-turn-helix domain-containing protein [Nocardia puris]MBF6369621.1 helix-turn-helix domain-containing protein [Nocardia puris]MBF6463196.1 helix-turn-helix domain-containing protein [Nocardia puris]RBO83653.1 helix-turn-helix protein [Nocardia puris]
MSENELGLFLRSRREAVPPALVGLPAGPRRRTPGLRRSELATLAGVSVEYLTRLEQGRDRHPSPSVLSALGDALRLTPVERVHLYRLTKGADPGFSCTGGVAPNREVRVTVRAVLQQLDPAPAAVVNRVGEVLACTEGYHRLMGPTGLLDDDPASFPLYVFTDPRARALYPDWDHVADEWVATIKQGPFRADPAVAVLADHLTVVAGAEFTRRVETVPSLPAATGVTRLAHPEAGPLRLAYEKLDLSADDDQQIVVHLPADAATAAALDALTGRRPGGLRAVSG